MYNNFNKDYTESCIKKIPLSTYCEEMHKNNLKKLRQLKGISVEKLAEAAGCSEQTIYKIQTGERDISSDWLLKLSKALNCYPCEILPDEWQKPHEKQLKHIDQDLLGRIIKTMIEECSKPDVIEALKTIGKEPNPEFLGIVSAMKYEQAVNRQSEASSGISDALKIAGTLLKM